ncbi:MAG: oligoendopeptidase F [bacterium]|nr:oligoendopeptidase F [bacterium]
MKKRNEIDNKYKWDLSVLKKVVEDEGNTVEILEKKVADLIQLKNSYTQNATSFYEALELYFDIMRSLTNRFVYFQQTLDVDLNDNVSQLNKNEIDRLYNAVNTKLSFFETKILELDYDVVLSFIKENKRLEKYKFYLEALFRYKKYTLSEDNEFILSSLSLTFASFSKTFNYLNDSDITFKDIEVDSKVLPLNNSNFILYLNNKNRKIRELAFKNLYNGYMGLKNTFSSLLIENINTAKALASIRGFNSTIEYFLYADNVDVLVYNNLIKVVNSNIDKLDKYMKIRKKILGLEELRNYDLYVPLVKEEEKEYTICECENLVKSAYQVLGQEYMKIVEEAFIDKWIDYLPNEGKKSGAYSYGTYDSKPYILTNYQGKYGCVSTVAHELAHSVHSKLACDNQDYVNSDYSIVVAEIASTVGQLLLADYVLKHSKSKEEKLFILNDILELFRTTIYRQTMFAEFEYIIHEMVDRDEVLTEQVLSDIYYGLNKKYYGNVVKLDEEIRYEWLRIPHFYRNFYVYKYATGLGCACAIVKDIMSGDSDKINNYLNILKSGGNDYPFEILKKYGYDLTKEDILNNAFSMFDDYLKQFEDNLEE